MSDKEIGGVVKKLLAVGAALTVAVSLSACKTESAESETDTLKKQVEMSRICEEGGGILIYDGGYGGYRCDFREGEK